jgi:sterol desaturase/sphingolipid hydroxylase (fatty acid hydroxylase superfamily)
VHHADLDFDVSTALRFHPIEIVGSMVYKIALVWAFGIHPIVVLVFEIVLNGTALFNHANFSIPARLERVMRWFGTYVAQPKANPQTMAIGIERFRTESDSALHRLLIQPFK